MMPLQLLLNLLGLLLGRLDLPPFGRRFNFLDAIQKSRIYFLDQGSFLENSLAIPKMLFNWESR
jgi:hypothetical protein